MKKASRKLIPDVPSHATHGARVLSDWLCAILAQAKPPKGKTDDTASRVIQAPPTRAGVTTRRPASPGQCLDP